MTGTGPGPDFSWQAQMGYTRDELIRGLPRAVAPYRVLDSSANPVEIVLDSRIVRFYTGQEGFRAIASMRIPVIPVKLEFFGFSNDQHDVFLHRFRTYMQKGGG